MPISIPPWREPFYGPNRPLSARSYPPLPGLSLRSAATPPAEVGRRLRKVKRGARGQLERLYVQIGIDKPLDDKQNYVKDEFDNDRSNQQNGVHDNDHHWLYRAQQIE